MLPGVAQDNPPWLAIPTYHNQNEGDDVWFNALPSYVGQQTPVCVGFSDPNHCSTAPSPFSPARPLSPRAFMLVDTVADNTGHRDMIPGVRPLFNYGMNSKSARQ